VSERTAEGERFARVDWYAEELGASVFVGCEFVDADLTEVTTRGARVDTTLALLIAEAQGAVVTG
jgi:uncharacterized protein YjbI with pentapeptide repeats